MNRGTAVKINELCTPQVTLPIEFMNGRPKTRRPPTTPMIAITEEIGIPRNRRPRPARKNIIITEIGMFFLPSFNDDVSLPILL
jgi:hypothetical protein